jgi:hypothetical protein
LKDWIIIENYALAVVRGIKAGNTKYAGTWHAEERREMHTYISFGNLEGERTFG